MKKLFLLGIVSLLASSSAFCNKESEKAPLSETRKETLTYATSGAFAWASVPSGVNCGIGKRWYSDNFAFGTSLNLSASLSVTPFVDLLLEGLYFIDSKRYVGLQLGLGAGKTMLKKFQYQGLEGEVQTYRFDDWQFLPLIKFIPFGKEWKNENKRQFFHLAVFPVGVSFNYGWEI